MDRKILVADDEKPIADIIKFNLVKEGFTVVVAANGEEAIKLFESSKPDLVILDVMMPKMDGFQVCRKIREKYTTPILMLTAKEEEVDKVLGLELGADDYITKPFGMKELIARVRANLRRVDIDEISVDNDNLLETGNLTIDFERYEVKKNDKIIELTLREFELLKYLSSQAGQIFSREQLLQDVWGYEYFGDIRTVDVTVRRLREKVEDDSSKPQYVLTKRGVGYYFRRP